MYLKEKMIEAVDGIIQNGRMEEIEELKEYLAEEMDTLLEKSVDVHEQWDKVPPMGVSQWRAYGQKYAYWDFFAKQIIKEAEEKAVLKGERNRLMAQIKEETKQELIRDWNCRCEKPSPDGQVCVGGAEGAYERCLICDRRVWR